MCIKNHKHVSADLKAKTSLTNAWRDDPLVVVRVDANVVGFQVERVLAVFYMLQFVLVKIRPSPQSGIDHVRETFTSSHLKHTNEVGGKGNT